MPTNDLDMSCAPDDDQDDLAPAVGGSLELGHPTAPRGPFRIHSVSELTGVPEPTLRAWERRYGVPAPERTASGYRLYGGREVEQVREMRRLCGAGMAAAEAARRVLASASGVADALQQGADPYQKMIRGMILSISQLDDVALEEQLQRALLLGTTTTLFDRVLAPTLVRVGQLWHDGRLSIAHEHFATQRIGKLVRDLTRLAIGGEDAEPALVACFADEDHEIGALGVALRLGTWGMRPIFFGARMPPAGVRTAVEAIGPKLVALSVTLAPERARARELVDGYAGACGAIPWMVGGAGVESIADLVANAGGLRAPSDSEALRAAVRSALGRAPRRGATRAPRRKTP